MHRKWRTFFLLTVALGPSMVTAQENQKEQIAFSAQIRNRGEVDSRTFDSKANSYDYLRTRLGVKFTPLENYSAFVQFQDSRVFGAAGKGSTTTDTNQVGLHQAYFQINKFLWNPIELKVGRMELNYGDQRLIGALDWSNTARSFDGAVVTFRFNDRMHLDVIGMKIEEAGKPYASADTNLIEDKEDRDFGGLYGVHKYSEAVQVDYYVLSVADLTRDVATGKKELEQVTVGVFARGDVGDFGYKTELAFQTGQQAGLDIAAYMVSGGVGYSMKESAWKPSFWIGADVLSGDNDAADDKYEVFNTLFATNHKFYGYMDYFLDLPKHTMGLGLQDFMVKTKCQPWKGSYLALDYHYFMSAKKNAAGENKFGQEIDLTGGFKFNDHFSFDLGAAVFLPDDLMKARFGGRNDIGYWSYLTMMFSF